MEPFRAPGGSFFVARPVLPAPLDLGGGFGIDFFVSIIVDDRGFGGFSFPLLFPSGDSGGFFTWLMLDERFDGEARGFPGTRFPCGARRFPGGTRGFPGTRTAPRGRPGGADPNGTPAPDGRAFAFVLGGGCLLPCAPCDRGTAGTGGTAPRGGASIPCAAPGGRLFTLDPRASSAARPTESRLAGFDATRCFPGGGAAAVAAAEGTAETVAALVVSLIPCPFPLAGDSATTSSRARFSAAAIAASSAPRVTASASAASARASASCKSRFVSAAPRAASENALVAFAE